MMKKRNQIVGIILVIAMSFIFTGYTQAPAEEKDNEIVIYMVRHGKTIFNTTGQVQGWSDTPLTDAGIQGAKNVGEGLKDIPFTTAYSSDMGRAVSTAEYILEKNDQPNVTLKKSMGLREWFYGGYEGHTNAEMWTPIFEEYGLTFDEDWSQYPELASKLNDEGIANAIAKNDPLHTAEKYEDIAARSKEAIETIIADTQKQGGGNVLLVSHGSEIPTILDIFVPGKYKGEDISNCSVTILKYKNGKYTLGVVGDKSYLEKGKASPQSNKVAPYILLPDKTLSVAATKYINGQYFLEAAGNKNEALNDEIVLYMVRHGKTIFNTTGQVQGWSDTPLTDAGIQGAKDVAKGLQDIQFTAAYSSDMGRAVSTAEYILKQNKQSDTTLKKSRGLREWYYGGYEGLTNAEMWNPIFEEYGLTFDEDWSQWAELSSKLNDEGIANAIAKNDPLHTAEKYKDIVTRSKEAIEKIIAETQKQGGGNVLIVSHGSEIPTILDIFVPGQYKGEDISNCSVTILKYKNGKYTLDVAGDKSYLEKGKNR